MYTKLENGKKPKKSKRGLGLLAGTLLLGSALLFYTTDVKEFLKRTYSPIKKWYNKQLAVSIKDYEPKKPIINEDYEPKKIGIAESVALEEIARVPVYEKPEKEKLELIDILNSYVKSKEQISKDEAQFIKGILAFDLMRKYLGVKFSPMDRIQITQSLVDYAKLKGLISKNEDLIGRAFLTSELWNYVKTLERKNAYERGRNTILTLGLDEHPQPMENTPFGRSEVDTERR